MPYTMSAKAVRWVPLDRDPCTLYEINKSMFVCLFVVALSHGMEDSARAGTDRIHWWNVAWVTFVSAENGAQWMLACIRAVGAREGVGVRHMAESLPLSSCATKFSQISIS